jgi:hypothetical protein
MALRYPQASKKGHLPLAVNVGSAGCLRIGSNACGLISGALTLPTMVEGARSGGHGGDLVGHGQSVLDAVDALGQCPGRGGRLRLRPLGHIPSREPRTSEAVM